MNHQTRAVEAMFDEYERVLACGRRDQAANLREHILARFDILSDGAANLVEALEKARYLSGLQGMVEAREHALRDLLMGKMGKIAERVVALRLVRMWLDAGCPEERAGAIREALGRALGE